MPAVGRVSVMPPPTPIARHVPANPDEIAQPACRFASRSSKRRRRGIRSYPLPPAAPAPSSIEVTLDAITTTMSPLQGQAPSPALPLTTNTRWQSGFAPKSRTIVVQHFGAHHSARALLTLH